MQRLFNLGTTTSPPGAHPRAKPPRAVHHETEASATSWKNLADRLQELDRLLATMKLRADMDNYRSSPASTLRSRRWWAPYRDYCQALEDEATAKEPLVDLEMKELAAAELEAAPGKPRWPRIDAELQTALLPRDPNDDRNLFPEIRAGTGGDEAALFAGDLLRMYTCYAEGQGLAGRDHLLGQRFRAGRLQAGSHRPHRRQRRLQQAHSLNPAGRCVRVPATETQGRIHTSACTVAVDARGDGGRCGAQPRGSPGIDTFQPPAPAVSINKTHLRCASPTSPPGSSPNVDGAPAL